MSTGQQAFLPGLEAPWEVPPERASEPDVLVSSAVDGESEFAPAKVAAPAAAFGPSLLPDNRLVRPLADVLTDVPPAWTDLLGAYATSEAGRGLCAFVDGRRAVGAEIYPDAPLRALSAGGPGAVRVVILGQDPYHGPGEAEGLAFSVRLGVRVPPSLRNIFKELAEDLPTAPGAAADLARSGKRPPTQGSLLPWVDQGVLLLNTCLTVERDLPASHAKHGWEGLTDRLLGAVASDPSPKVFMLWGAHAQAKSALIEGAGAGRHALFASNHPSPLAARRPPVPFLGSRPFSRANAWLVDRGLREIDWRSVLRSPGS